ncbi:MAG: dihydroorotate dehydrogenase, partial [Nitrospinota bacterium]
DKGGIEFGSDAGLLAVLTERVRKAVEKPLIVKLSPNVTDIKPFAVAVEENGADAISAINTLKGMSIDTATRKPRIKRITGGLSGPAIRPVALRIVYECVKTVKIPVIGIGGIASLNDALEFFIAGAAAVQVGTMNFVEPDIAENLVDRLRAYCQENRITDIKEIVGSLKTG